MGDSQVVEGGCLCGTVRFQLTGRFSSIVHCHCSMCRRASGALVVTWITLRKEGFKITKGELMQYPSSDHGQRGFCGRCGSPIAFWTGKLPKHVDINLGSLDHPERYRATRHVWTASQIPWLTVDPELPRHEAFSS